DKSTPTRRIRSPCCARAARGNAAAPPMSVMNARRRMAPPPAVASWPRPDDDNTLERRPASHKVPAVVLHFVDPLLIAWHCHRCTQTGQALHSLGLSKGLSGGTRYHRVLMVVRFCFRCYWLGYGPNAPQQSEENSGRARQRGSIAREDVYARV